MQKLKVSKQFVALKTRQEENSEDLISKPGYSMPFICSNILCFKRGADLIQRMFTIHKTYKTHLGEGGEQNT